MFFIDIIFDSEFKNSAWTEPAQPSVYGQPKSGSLSGQRGQDRYGKLDNTDYLTSTGVTGGAPDQCATCGGSGILDEHSCPECNGTGVIRNESAPEVESAYESASRSGDGGIENKDDDDEFSKELEKAKKKDKDSKSDKKKSSSTERSDADDLHHKRTVEKSKKNKSSDDGIYGKVKKFDYPRGKAAESALDFPRSSGNIKNESYADWSGIGFRQASQDVPDDYKASTLFIDMAPYKPTLERGKEKYGTNVAMNDLLKNISDYNRQCYYNWKNPKNVGDKPEKIGNGPIWDKAERASEEAFGEKRWPFIQWWYSHHGGK